ncbi:unnamed protein product [Sphagnum tenellum]
MATATSPFRSQATTGSYNDGRTGEPNCQRPLSSSLPEEEQAQLEQRLVKPKGNGEARKSQALSDGEKSGPSSQRLFLSEVPNEEMVQADKNTTELSECIHLFQVLFEKEEGARATRKLAAVKWSGWALSFSKYSALFRPNEHGAEMLLTHSIKVRFPDLHVQLSTEKVLTIMASSIRDVLDIESLNFYIKRSAGPMVTVEVKDISKLAGIIRIPSMAEGAGLGDTTTHRILYSGLPNQCKM